MAAPLQPPSLPAAALSALALAGCASLAGLSAGSDGGASDSAAARDATRTDSGALHHDARATDGAVEAARDAGRDATFHVDGGPSDSGIDSCATGGAIAIACGQNEPFAVSVNDASVYWSSTGGASVAQCALGGCNGLPTTTAEMQTGVGALVLTKANIYWTAGDTVWRCGLVGCADSPMTVVTSTAPTAGIAGTPTSSYIFWSTGVLSGGVFRTDKTVGTTVTLASNQNDPGALATDLGDRFVAFAELSSGVVHVCPIGGCPDAGPTVVASGQEKPTALAFGEPVDGGAPELFWVTQADPGTIVGRSATLSAAAVTLATGQHSPSGIAVDDTTVYWTTDPSTTSDGAIYACPRTGCQGSPTLVVGGQTAPHGIAVDARYVYWTNAANPGGVFKVAKPPP